MFRKSDKNAIFLMISGVSNKCVVFWVTNQFWDSPNNANIFCSADLSVTEWWTLVYNHVNKRESIPTTTTSSEKKSRDNNKKQTFRRGRCHSFLWEWTQLNRTTKPEHRAMPDWGAPWNCWALQAISRAMKSLLVLHKWNSP